MEEQNKNPLAPLSTGNLAKANSSIGITNKILSESIYEFHGDFKGEKIWEVQTGIKSTIAEVLGYTILLIYNDVLLFYNKSIGFKLFNKHTGELISEKNEKLSLISIVKSNKADNCLFSIYGHCYERDGVKLKGYHTYLRKLSLPHFKLIKTAELLFDDYLGEEKDYIVDLQITPDNKYVVTTWVHKPQNKMTIVFWDYDTLEKINSIEIGSDKKCENLPSVENGFHWEFTNTSVDELSIKNKIIFIDGKCLFMVVKRKKYIQCAKQDDYKSLRFGTYWLLSFYEYANNKIELSNEVELYGSGYTYQNTHTEDEWIWKYYNILFEKEMNVNELTDCFNDLEKVHNHGFAIFKYNAKINLILNFHDSRGVDLHEIISGKTIKSFTADNIIHADNLSLSNAENHLMSIQNTHIEIYDSKTFKLLVNYDISKGRPFEFAETKDGVRYEYEDAIKNNIKATEGYYNHNYNTSVFDIDDKYIYTLCTDGSIHKWK